MLTNKFKVLPLTYRGKYGFWRLLNIIIIGMLVFGVVFTYHFIYFNIYSTIANANAITSLRSNLNIYDLDLQAYEKAQAAIVQKKYREDIPSNIRNIFYYKTITSTYVVTSTSP